MKIDALGKVLDALRIGQYVNLNFTDDRSSLLGLTHLVAQQRAGRIQLLNLTEEGAKLLFSLGEWGEGSRNVKICFTCLSLPEDRAQIANALAEHLSSATPVTMPDQHMTLTHNGKHWVLEMIGGTEEAREFFGEYLRQSMVEVEVCPKQKGRTAYRILEVYGEEDELAFSERLADAFGLKLEMP